MKWEYKTIVVKTSGWLGGKVDLQELDRICNKMGQDGWELATNTASATAYGETICIILIFKRPIA